jgi:hypothetical protein
MPDTRQGNELRCSDSLSRVLIVGSCAPQHRVIGRSDCAIDDDHRAPPTARQGCECSQPEAIEKGSLSRLRSSLLQRKSLPMGNETAWPISSKGLTHAYDFKPVASSFDQYAARTFSRRVHNFLVAPARQCAFLGNRRVAGSQTDVLALYILSATVERTEECIVQGMDGSCSY